MKPFTQRVIQIIRDIPEGKVMSYGQIAAVAGSPRGARQVVRILHTLSRIHELPWHRVVNIKGEVALTDEESRGRQIGLLHNEGIICKANGQLDLEEYRFIPIGEEEY